MTKQALLLVANGSEAQLYKYLDGGKHLNEINEFSNAMRRFKDQDIVTDRPGVMSGGGDNISGKNAMAPETSPTDRAKKDFAKLVISQLESFRTKDAVQSIDIVAEPSMLGLLRGEMNKHLQDLVDKEVSKDGIGKAANALLNLVKAA